MTCAVAATLEKEKSPAVALAAESRMSRLYFSAKATSTAPGAESEPGVNGVNAARKERRSSWSKASVPLIPGTASPIDRSSTPAPGLPSSVTSALSNFSRLRSPVILPDSATEPVEAPGGRSVRDHSSMRLQRRRTERQLAVEEGVLRKIGGAV